jgi:hypothetical protein
MVEVSHIPLLYPKIGHKYYFFQNKTGSITSSSEFGQSKKYDPFETDYRLNRKRKQITLQGLTLAQFCCGRHTAVTEEYQPWVAPYYINP